MLFSLVLIIFKSGDDQNDFKNCTTISGESTFKGIVANLGV